ncbi:c-type cytochrome domain-containing protein [Planctomicrobium sp. SH661]|uniref:c-type cytochrome domain-containing protein n=1 Tax=Planctomicrobium sp. SH661 TaxID=3448124 RepID=UPI003F5CB5BC
MRRTLLFSTLLFAAGHNWVYAEDQKPDAPPAEKVTFVDDVLPIFRSKCGSCHNANDKKGGLVLDNYSAMMLGGSSGTSIEAGDAGNSYLFSLITHASEPKMPPNADKLPAEQLAVIEKWINLGALENSGSKAAMKKKPSLAKIEVSTARPAEVAMPERYLGDPAYEPSHVNAVTALAVSPWASLAAVSGYKQIGIYDSKTLDLLGVLPFPEGRAQIAKFSRNGSLLLVGGGRGGESGRVVVYDVRTGERKVELGDEYDEVLAADISSDQTLIALGGPKKMLRVYSVETGELLFENKKHTDWITAIEFSPDGVLLASGDRSNGLIVWESGTGELFYDLQGHKAGISDVSWRPDSNVVASASEDGTIKLWEMQNGGLVKSWDAHGGGATSLEYTRDGDLVSTGRDRVTRYWKGDGAKIRDLPAVADIAMEVAFDAETKRILTGDWTGQITLWNAEDGAQLGSINTNPPSVKKQLAQVTAGLEQLKGQLNGHQTNLANLQKGIAERQKKAEEGAALAAKAAENSKQALAKKQQAEEAVKAKQAAMVAAEGTLKETQAAVALLNTQLQQHTEKANAAQAAMKGPTDALAEVTQARQVAATALTDLTAKSQEAAKAAEPTEAEKPLLESDEAVKKAVADRQEAAKVALEAMNQAKVQLDAAQAKMAEVEKQLAAAKTEFEAMTKVVQTAREQMTAANTTMEAAGKGMETARKTLEEVQAELTAAVQNEQAAAKGASEAQAAAEKLAAAAKPTEEEQKGIDAANAAIAAAQAQLAVEEARLARLQKISSELAQPTAAQ